ncbi:YafY family protein [Bacillus spongiae]|uniref:YafY family protein n=1 Tax=Bacillus spongiae TaxID=2683610 RepID=A0ABU8HC14_9BACI
MSRSGRLLELLISLNTKHRFTVQELADEFSVSRRTMLRDLHLLSEMGVPLFSSSGPNGGYSLIRKQELPPIPLTTEEATGLLLSYEIIEQHDGPFKYENLSTLTKIRATMSVEMLQKVEQLKSRLAIEFPRRSVNNYYLKDILQASLERNHLEIEYESRSGFSTRTIFPFGLFLSNGLWYALSFCYRRNSTVTFRVDRIVSLKVSQQSIEPISTNMTVEKWLKQSDSSTKELTLKAQLTKLGCKILDPHPLGEWIEMNPDGTGAIEERIKESDIHYVGRQFLSLGAEIIIEQPVELIQFIQEEAVKLINQYSKV